MKIALAFKCTDANLSVSLKETCKLTERLVIERLVIIFKVIP